MKKVFLMIVFITISILLNAQTKRLIIDSTGNVAYNDSKLKSDGGSSVSLDAKYICLMNGWARIQRLEIKANVWSDFVFKSEFKLKSLKDVEDFINKNQHLPDVPSETEVKTKGIDVATMNAILLQKIEELTLYVIEQNKKIEALQAKVK